jgi:hypothetical protein
MMERAKGIIGEPATPGLDVLAMRLKALEQRFLLVDGRTAVTAHGRPGLTLFEAALLNLLDRLEQVETELRELKKRDKP